MPLYTHKCDDESCGRMTETLLRLSEMEDPRTCPDCQGPMTRILTAKSVHAQHFDPVVLFKNHDGTYRFPGSTEAPTPAGCERVELRTFADIDRVSAHINHEERRKIEQATEQSCREIEAVEAANRGDLRMAMQRMTPQQRAFAEYAIRRNNERRPKSFDADFMVEVRELDASSREEYRSAHTGTRGRK